MTPPLTIHGELRLPAAFMHDKHLEELERQLQGYGLLPLTVQDRRWRLDPESPGGYVLQYTCVLTSSSSETTP